MRFRVLLQRSAALLSLTVPVHAGWYSTPSLAVPAFPPEVKDSCGANSESVATAASNGANAAGGASGVDFSMFCDSGAENNAEGSISDFWYFKPDPGGAQEGWAHVEAAAHVVSDVRIDYANAAVAALGFASAKSNLLDGELKAISEKAIMETTSAPLLSITWQGVSFSPLITSGANKKHEEIGKTDTGEKCTNYVHLTRESGAFTKAWVDEAFSLNPGKCFGEVYAKVKVSVDLNTCSDGIHLDEADPSKWTDAWMVKPAPTPSKPRSPGGPGGVGTGSGGDKFGNL
jgi:hypothetical protein